MFSCTTTPIKDTDGRFEWYQYNEDLWIIHSVEDDMFHAGSILRALGSKKLPEDWVKNKQTIELLSRFSGMEDFSATQLINEKETTFNHVRYIKGTYIHRLLVNHFAIWASPAYAYKLARILDDHFELKRRIEESLALEDMNETLIQKGKELVVPDRILLDNNQTLIAKNDELLQIDLDQTID